MRAIASRSLRIGVGVIAVAVGLASAQEKPNTLTPAEAKEGWKLLFNGTSLDGWRPYPTSAPPATGDWTVADDAISCPGTSSGWLATNQDFSDFNLTLQFRGGEKVNSGVFLRSQKEGQPHKTGYELQIWDYQPAGYKTGSLVGSLKASPAKIKPDEWNTYNITASGDHYIVILNGKTILDGHDSTHSSGVIGLQCQKENKVEFRSIELLAFEKGK